MLDDKEKQRRFKIGQTLKGRMPWNKGIKNWRVISEETKRKIGLAHKGKKVIVSEDTKRKISQSLKGRKPKNLELLHSLPRTTEWKKKIGVAHKGMFHTRETKAKISDAKRNPLRGVYRATRECFRYREWHRSILLRDKFICQTCNEPNKKIHVDHIKPFSQILRLNKIKSIEEALVCEELWNVNNGRTLCVECHRKTATWGYRGKKLDNDIVHTL